MNSAPGMGQPWMYRVWGPPGWAYCSRMVFSTDCWANTCSSIRSTSSLSLFFGLHVTRAFSHDFLKYFFFLIPYCSLCFKHPFPEVVPACVRGSAVPCGGSVMEPAGISCAEHRAAPACPHRGHPCSLCCWSLGTCTLHSSVHQTKHIPTRSHFYLLKFEHFYSSPGNYADVALLSKVREI